MSKYTPAIAQDILFDFDSASLHTSLPIILSEGGITAHFSGGYSIQDNTSPVVPTGFTGRFIYPNSIYQSDLIINFNKKITDFSIWYSCQELACDDAATMKVTAYLKGTLVGSNTKMTNYPGTWPVDTLACSFSNGFDSVVVHYFKKPPTCTDYGVIFLADNMRVTEYKTTSISDPDKYLQGFSINNPITGTGIITFNHVQTEELQVALYDMSGRKVMDIFKGQMGCGKHQIYFDAKLLNNGLYVIYINWKNCSKSCKLMILNN